MDEYMRELIAADMGDDRYECPVCLDLVSEGDKCTCSSWTEDEWSEFFREER